MAIFFVILKRFSTQLEKTVERSSGSISLFAATSLFFCRVSSEEKQLRNRKYNGQLAQVVGANIGGNAGVC